MKLLRGAEEANMDLLLSKSWDSPDYTYINGGKVYSYKDLLPKVSNLSLQPCQIRK